MVDDKPKEQETPKVEAPAKEDKTDELDERIRKIAQAEADRVRTEKTKIIKSLEEEIELLKKEKMSEKERREYEAKQAQDALSVKERELNLREMKLYAIDELKNEGLDLSLTDWVIGADKESTKGRIATFKGIFQKALNDAVDSRMKAAGREPGKGRVDGVTSGIAGMTAKEIKDKTMKDPEWFRKHENEIYEAMKENKIK